MPNAGERQEALSITRRMAGGSLKANRKPIEVHELALNLSRFQTQIGWCLEKQMVGHRRVWQNWSHVFDGLTLSRIAGSMTGLVRMKRCKSGALRRVPGETGSFEDGRIKSLINLNLNSVTTSVQGETSAHGENLKRLQTLKFKVMQRCRG